MRRQPAVEMISPLAGPTPPRQGRQVAMSAARAGITALWVALLAGIILSPATSSAGVVGGGCDKNWDGGLNGESGEGGSWAVDANWDPDGVPTNAQLACVDAPGTYTVTVPSSHAVGGLVVGGGATGTQTLKVEAGDLSAGNLGLDSFELGIVTEPNGVIDLDSPTEADVGHTSRGWRLV